jgi:hypothetical protein
LYERFVERLSLPAATGASGYEDSLLDFLPRLKEESLAAHARWMPVLLDFS